MIPGSLAGGSPRNGIPEPTGRLRRLTPQQREAAYVAAVLERNHELRAAATRARALAWHRDVPRTCICDWALAHGAAYVRSKRHPDCPYHTKED